jgi:hypothetical protein
MRQRPVIEVVAVPAADIRWLAMQWVDTQWVDTQWSAPLAADAP